MKIFLTYLFVGMGVLFLLQLVGLGYLYVVDPLNLKPLLFGSETTQTRSITESVTAEVQTEGEVAPDVDTEPGTQTLPVSNLSPEQAHALKLIGVEPETLPQFFTETQLQCFVGVLGQARVEEIKAGAIPSISEYFQAKDCV